MFGKKTYNLSALSPEEQSEVRIVLYDFACTIPFGRSAFWGISREEAQRALDHAHTDEMTKADIQMTIKCLKGYINWMDLGDKVPMERQRELRLVLPAIQRKLEAML